MLKGLKVHTQIALGFCLILLVSAAIIAFAVQGLKSSSQSFKSYRQLARASVLSGRVQANMLMASNAKKNFLYTRDEKHLQSFRERFELARGFAEEQQAAIVDVDRRELNRVLLENLRRYGTAAEELFVLMQRRDTVLQETLNPEGIRMRKNLTEIMVSAFQDDDAEAAYVAGRALEKVLLGRLYMLKFLEDNKDADVERVRSELGVGFAETYAEMAAAIEDPQRKELLRDFSEARGIYFGAFEDIVSTIKSRNTLLYSQMGPLEQSVADISEQIKLSLKADQDELGPRVQASNVATVRAVFIGAFIAVALSILIAWWFVRTINKSITALGRSEAETERLSSEIAARKEAEQTLKQAKDRLTHELAVARELSDAADRAHQVFLQGESIAVRALRENIEAQANSNEPLLMTGPSGAGQEAVARAVHRNSKRAGRPFIYVACPLVSTSDDTLFGFRQDDSEQDDFGKMALADGGTLYLEGIETLSQSSQEKLLVTLREAARIRAAGGVPVPNVRLIAFTSTDPAKEVQEGRLAGELERIIGSQRLMVPSLSERKADIITLANEVAENRARSVGKTLDGLSSEAEEKLLQYSWPGNIRELQSVIERAVVLCRGNVVEIPDELLQEGRRLGGYTLEHRLGAGAMGEVWLGRHSLLARPAAVKVIREQALNVKLAEREIIRERFQREARATAQLRSPHTVELYDFGVDEDGSFYYVMEFLVGVDLESLVERFGTLPPARAVYLLSQACLSLGEAHDAGLIHRDVKPSNLFTCRLGQQFDFLKLLDFGIVRLTSSANHTVTAAGISGTPATLSPEVLGGAKAGVEADIYGLGCVAYWMLAGRNVFEADSLMALLKQHTSEEPEPLSTQFPSVPHDLDALILSCLAKNPNQRPRSAIELGEELASYTFDQPWNLDHARNWWKAHLPSTRDDLGAPDSGLSQTISLQDGATIENPMSREKD